MNDCMLHGECKSSNSTGYPIIHLHGPSQPGVLKLQDANVALSAVTWHGYHIMPIIQEVTAWL